MIFGLTGGIASGKSYVSEQFAALGASIVDTDILARAVLAPGSEGLAAVVQAFGAAILDAQGGLNRRALRALVFADANARAELEAITHPRIRAAAFAQLQEGAVSLAARRHGETSLGFKFCQGKTSNGTYQMIVVPLMAEAGRYPFIDEVIVVDCSVATQLERLMARDNVDSALAQQMLAAQASRAQRLAIAEHVVSNDGGRAALTPVIATLHARFCHAQVLNTHNLIAQAAR
jgi:dephospho-CoA kinase